METSMICALPDDLLLKILHCVPIKDAIATSILSQRWRYVWTMMFILEFKDDGISESFGCFIDKSLQLHKAPKLSSLTVELGQHYPVGVDVIGEWVENAVNRGVKYLDFKLLCGPEPTRLPKSLYTCETLVVLTLSNQILVDVPSPTHLPSLLCMTLDKVVYKDEDSLYRLLSSSPVLERLKVIRHESDNLKTFMVKVSSLTTLSYDCYGYTTIQPNDEVDVDDVEEDEDDLIESLVIDSPALRDLRLWNIWEDDLLIENMHCLEEAFIGVVSNPDVKFLRCFSFVIYLDLYLTQPLVACCNAIIIFSRLIEFCLFPNSLIDWMEPLMFFLQNSPKLKTLTIDNVCGGPSRSWNQPSNIPECLSNHLEVFQWKDYRGGEVEKQLLAYILANSNCLKTVEISLEANCNNLEETRKEIESMPTISASSRLLFSPSLLPLKCNGALTE